MTTHKKAAGESGSIAKQSVMPIILANSPLIQQANSALAPAVQVVLGSAQS